MVLNGANGETAEEISRVLGYGEGKADAVNDFCRTFANEVAKVDPSTRLDIANVVVYNTHNDVDGIRLKEPFTAALSEYYDANVETFDFSVQHDEALRRINGWCAEKTENMIPSILDEVDDKLLSYFMNAIYFKGIWADKFNKDATVDEEFTPEGGKTKKVPMMRRTGKFAFTANDTFKALSLPYGNGAFRMTVFLPQEGHTIKEVAGNLTADSFRETLSTMGSQEVIVRLPRFETASTLQLKDILVDLGMRTSFVSGQADFTGISDYADCISMVLQKARVKVDEEGTEAAAVTIIGMVEATAIRPEEPVPFIADHPFLYFISEISTGSVLFAGAYTGD